MGYPPLKHKDSFLDSQIPLFFHFIHELTYIPLFSPMSNEIILFQILCKLLKYLLFSLMKMRILKFYPMWAMFYQWPTIIWNLIFWKKLYITIGKWFWSHSYILYTLAHKVFLVKILGQKNCLDILYESLNFFFPH